MESLKHNDPAGRVNSDVVASRYSNSGTAIGL